MLPPRFGAVAAASPALLDQGPSAWRSSQSSESSPGPFSRSEDSRGPLQWTKGGQEEARSEALTLKGRWRPLQLHPPPPDRSTPDPSSQHWVTIHLQVPSPEYVLPLLEGSTSHPSEPGSARGDPALTPTSPPSAQILTWCPGAGGGGPTCLPVGDTWASKHMLAVGLMVRRWPGGDLPGRRGLCASPGWRVAGGGKAPVAPQTPALCRPVRWWMEGQPGAQPTERMAGERGVEGLPASPDVMWALGRGDQQLLFPKIAKRRQTSFHRASQILRFSRFEGL